MNGRMHFYARDVYPEDGLMETSTTVIPDEFTQRVVENNEKSVELAAEVKKGATSKGTLGTFAAVIAVIAAIVFLSN